MINYKGGIEIMQGMSGSLGVVLTVPVTAFIAAFLIGRKGKNELTCEKQFVMVYICEKNTDDLIVYN